MPDTPPLDARQPPFHLAIAVDDLAAAEHFYHALLGCPIGRRSESWIDFDFYGHQLVTHLEPIDIKSDTNKDTARNQVDGDAVPVRHFGCVLEWGAWERLIAQVQSAGLSFLIEPRIRFVGKPGEQGTFFIQDPAGNALEFKTFKDQSQLFAR